MSTDRTELAARHTSTAATFSQKVQNVSDWDVPTPVVEWSARDIVRHLVDWSRGMFGQVEGITFAEIPSVDVDPAEAWRKHTEQMTTLLDNAGIEKLTMPAEMFDGMPLLDAIATFYVPDVFMHTWDLATATGQASGLDQAACHEMYEGMKAQEEMIRSSGQFGEQQPVADDASSEQKLMAFLGRDPQWAPPAAPSV
ncbi:TIGR03086 family metal-binding protein [Luteococcus sp. Sow4_B9]|uniref:TIGR03086 family metal-binding protein n=1 Tax=Luteococcus sp. Sow4_B9 TaxID=3438792 RepID=UPI003F99DA5F